MTDTDYSTTPLQKKVYVLLINYKNPRFPRTQKEVADMLGIQKSTCSDATRKLLKLEFIAPISNMKTNVLYRRGKHHKIMESHIKSNYLEEGEWFDMYGEGIRPPNNAEPYKPVFRAHINGTWIMFTVTQKGELHKFLGNKFNDKGERLLETLFSSEAYSLPGSSNYMDTVFYDGKWSKVRYQETASKKLFYVQPSSKIIFSDERTPDEDIVGPFVKQCIPLLNYLEKYAGWQFEKNSDGEYIVAASGRSGKTGNGSQKEYGMDGFMTNLIHDYTGDTGIVGKSPFWFDHSENALGANGECEFSKGDYIEAIDDLPKTKKTVDLLFSKVQSLEFDNIQLKASILEKENFLLERQSSMYGILTMPSIHEVSVTKTASGNTGNKGMYQ